MTPRLSLSRSFQRYYRGGGSHFADHPRELETVSDIPFIKLRYNGKCDQPGDPTVEQRLEVYELMHDSLVPDIPGYAQSPTRYQKAQADAGGVMNRSVAACPWLVESCGRAWGSVSTSAPLSPPVE